MLIVLIYLIVFIIQFFSPLWFQLLLMGINFILPDNIPIADEIIQSIILANKIAKTTKKGYTGYKWLRKIYIYRYKILIGFILILFIFGVWFMQNISTSNSEKGTDFIEKDISEIRINTDELVKSRIGEKWIKQNMMYDNKNDRYYLNDLQVLKLIEDIVIQNNKYEFLDAFSKDELGLLRNIIFARKGYIYKRGKYKEYFSNKSWYNPSIENENDIKLTVKEKELIEKIQKYENIK
jgi:possible serine/threonine kinase